MANRVVRSDILESEKVNKLTWAGEVFYRRLMSILDDYGRGDGRVSIIRSKLFPLRLDKVSESDITKWLAECQDAGLVRVYHIDKKPYLELFNFGQTLRQKKPKFPPPPNVNTCEQMQADASNSVVRKETKGNESERNPPSKYDADDYFKSGEQAFEEIKSDERFVEQLLWIVRGNGFQACDEITVMLATKRFITKEQAKEEFYYKPKSEVKKHLVNWINKNSKEVANVR